MTDALAVGSVVPGDAVSGFVVTSLMVETDVEVKRGVKKAKGRGYKSCQEAKL